MTVPYTPVQIPDDPKQIIAALRDDQAALKRGLESAWGYSEQRYLTAQPARVRPGMMVLADGTNWNPGFGEGLYRRNAANTAWVFDGSQYINAQSRGVVADGVTDDTAAWILVINYAKTFTYPVRIQMGTGLTKVTGALPDLTGFITIEGDNPRASQFICYGSTTIFNIRGTGTRSTATALRNLGIDGLNMSTNYTVSVDFAQSPRFDNVNFTQCYRVMSLRQCGDVIFDNCLIDAVRGDIGVYAYGGNASRNGENDQIDLVIFNNTIMQGTYVAGGAANTTELLILDGRVHTVQFNGLRLLNSGTGLVTQNTPGLVSNLWPRFLTGSCLEIENMYLEPAIFEYCTEFWVDSIFFAGSATKDGMTLTANVNNFRVNKGTINSNYLCGAYIVGATNVDLGNVTVYNNSLVGAGTKSGIYIGSGSGRVSVTGGFAGKATYLPAYTENQKYGIEIDAAYSGIVTVDGVDLRGNNTGTLYDGGGTAVGSHVKDCPGLNPGGAAAVTLGASGGTYTAGLVRESVNLYNGSGVVATIDGVVTTTTTPASFRLNPRQSFGYTYVTIPNMVTNKE